MPLENLPYTNLFDDQWELGVINAITGANNTNNNYIRCKNYIPVKELTTYSIYTTNTTVVVSFINKRLLAICYYLYM